jgi:predicted dehydrogenase
MAIESQVRLALIGAGNMANGMHYPSLAEFDDVEMAGLCDLDAAKLSQTAGKFHIESTFSDYKKMLDEVQPQAVYILMPPHHMFDIIVECLNRKLHVFIEKPPGLTVDQTRHLARLAEKNNCLTMTGFQRRFTPLLVEARKAVEARGPIIQCLARFVKSNGVEPYYGGAIDILTCDAIHAVDNLRWMGGEVKKVVGKVDSFYTNFPNAFNALVEFESGAAGMLLCNWVTGRRIYSVEMHAKNISAYAEPDDRAIIYKDGDEAGEVLLNTDAAQSEAPHHYLGFFAENRHFIDCVQSKQQPQTNFSDGVKTMELVQKIYDSPL